MSINSEWINDEKLENDLRKYVAQNLKRIEILDFVRRDYPDYQWSSATLARRLRAFQINYIDYNTDIETVKQAVQTELDGPGKLLGYRAMNLKLRTEHGVKVPRHLVHKVMEDLDPDGLAERSVQKKARKKKVPFTSDGPMSLLSLDGHDKLCGYQNSTFPLGVYGCLDTFSRKIMYLFVCYSNSDPKIIGKKYFQFLYDTKTLPFKLRLDRGTETGKMAALHVFLAEKMTLVADDPTEAVIFGPSTSNKIERWWRDLHERLEKFFKLQLKSLLHSGEYDPNHEQDRQLLAYVYIPILQRECDLFVAQWNSHRIRAQNKLELPTGVPNHMFDFPEKYCGVSRTTMLTEEILEEAAVASGILEVQIDDHPYMPEDLKRQCKQYLPDPETVIESKEAADAYLFLKRKIAQL